MNSELKILLVEDSPGDAELICYEIKKCDTPFIRKVVTSRNEYLSSLEEFKPDIIISDYALPQFSGLEVLELRNDKKPDLPFILVTGIMDEETAVECMKAGADDYILKNNLSRIGPAVHNAIRKIRLIEEKRIAEKALVESTERYRRLVDQSPDAIAVHCEGKLVFVNAAAVKLSGASGPEDLIGRSILDVIHPASRQKVMERIGSVMTGTEVPLFEEKFVKFDGTVIDVEVVGIPYIYQGKSASQVIVREITARKESEKALKESELRFMQIAENSGEWIWEVDKHGLYTYSSPVIKEILGYEPEEVVGKKYFYDFFPDDIKEQYKEKAFKFFEKKERLRNFVNPNLHKSGKVVILSTSGLPMLDSDEKLVGYRGSDNDITDRINNEQKLKLSEQKYRTIFENIQDLYFEISMGGTIIDASPSTATISRGQYTREDLLGKDFRQFFYHPGEMETLMKQLFENGFISDFEVSIKNRDGSKIPASVSTRLVLDENTMQQKMIGSIRDISERKKTEEELIRAMVKAEESDRLKTAFLHNISHEIRTPMNAIVGFSALISEPDTDEESRKSFSETIIQSSNHLLAIITDIVDISNIEANLVKIDNKETDVVQLINSVIHQFTSSAERKKISIVYENRLPHYAQRIVSDPIKLRQIITNLVSNAVKFTDSGHISISLMHKENFIEFSISDTGIGIPVEHHSRIFDRFYQVQNTLTKPYEGTGLGLSISKSYVDLLGGKIWFKSIPDEGSTFYFTVPYEVSAIMQRPAIDQRMFLNERRTILVAEDNDSNYRLIYHFLHETNALIVRASNGKEAVEYLQAGNKVDLVLMDIKMPVMDGYTAVRKIRELNLKMPVIAQTAYADDHLKLTEAGFDGFLPKPFDRRNFIQVINGVF